MVANLHHYAVYVLMYLVLFGASRNVKIGKKNVLQNLIELSNLQKLSFIL